MAGFQRSAGQSRWTAALAAGLIAVGLAGCRQPPQPANSGTVVPDYNRETGRLERISYDLDRNGKPDAWLFMDGTQAARAELDQNDDGAVDRWEFYDTQASSPAAADALPRGVLVRAEQSTRFDGTVSRWERYTNGQMTSVDEDTSGDGQPDKWETWKNGVLVEVALDTKHTGKPDRRIVYPGDGGPPQMLVDETGDGTFRPASGS
jgi:hypothetical protein